MELGQMKALQTTCIVGLIAFIGFYLADGNRPVDTVPDAMPEAAAKTVAPALYAEASAKLAIALRAEPGSVTSAGPGPCDGRSRNHRLSHRTKIGVAGPSGYRPAAAGSTRCVRRCLQDGVVDAGFPVSNPLRLVRTAARREAGGRSSCVHSRTSRSERRSTRSNALPTLSVSIPTS